jgi:hypothetical protein
MRGYECTRTKSDIIVKLKQNTGGLEQLDREKTRAVENIKNKAEEFRARAKGAKESVALIDSIETNCVQEIEAHAEMLKTGKEVIPKHFTREALGI